MLKLFLLRHAQADGGYDVDDHERPLTTYGIEQAKNVASSLPEISLTICSSAKRTRMTLDGIVNNGITIQKTIYSDEIYNGAAGDLLAAIQGAGAEESLLIIAHNPGIHQLANMLATEDNTPQREKLRYQYAPASLSVLECEIEKWVDLKPAENKLVDFIIPT